MKYLAIILFLLIDYFALSQVLEPREKFDVKELPKVSINEVMWHRRLWREIDLTEKINQHLYFPNEKEERNYCLYDLLYHYLTKGIIKAYSSENDEFKNEISIEEMIAINSDTILKDGKQYVKKLDSREVVKLWLKEDWFYNSKYSRIEVRIIGMCPVKIKRDENGNIVGYQQLFWLYFPHIRKVLVNHEALKKQKEGDQRISFDDVFVKHRMFNSYILLNKINKLYQVRKNKSELDIKLENEKSKSYLYNPKSKLWQ